MFAHHASLHSLSVQYPCVLMRVGPFEANLNLDWIIPIRGGLSQFDLDCFHIGLDYPNLIWIAPKLTWIYDQIGLDYPKLTWTSPKLDWERSSDYKAGRAKFYAVKVFAWRNLAMEKSGRFP